MPVDPIDPNPPADPPAEPEKPPANPPANGPEDNFWKRKAEKAERDLEQRKRADMTESERLKAELDEERKNRTAAEERANRTLMRSRFELEAAKIGCVDPDAAFTLLGDAALQVDEAGKVLGIQKALERLQKDKPYLFGQSSPRRPAAGGNPPLGNGSSTTNQRMNDFFRGHR